MPEQKQAYVSHKAGWEDGRDIPVFAWMEKYTAFFNDHLNDKEAMKKLHTDDWVHIKPDGTQTNGFEDSYNAQLETYAPFAGGFKHEPKFWTLWQNENGWELVGQATLVAKFPEGTGESTFTGADGKKWDVGLPGFFHFWYVPDGDSFKMKRSEVFSDSFPAIQEMMKRGMIKS